MNALSHSPGMEDG